ncbi:MAG TPA: LanC-like protein [Gaiella sp.]|nr:LanC-like protein [Gaiella sp.]
MLYRPQAFVRLTDEPWDDEGVRAAIRRLVARVDDAFDPVGLWPANEWDAWRTPTPLEMLYAGAAGVLWALDDLRRRGLAETRIDLAAAARAALDGWRREPDFMEGSELPSRKEAGLLSGESGILLVAWRLTGDAACADELHEHVRANVDNEAEEVMWGTPGTLVAARRMLAWTGEERWRRACEESAEALWARRDERGLWTQRLYGKVFQGLGTAHGLVGNVAALRPCLDEARREQLERETNALLAGAAIHDGDLANWPATPAETPGSHGESRLQWCWGAPGVVTAAGEYLEPELVLAGARLTWCAGAHGPEKGFGICHGTAGNGYALLEAFRLTGDEEWLARARRFAVHALGQAEEGGGRFSLFTGDPGVMLFAADCLTGEARFPIVG